MTGNKEREEEGKKTIKTLCHQYATNSDLKEKYTFYSPGKENTDKKERSTLGRSEKSDTLWQLVIWEKADRVKLDWMCFHRLLM